MNVIDVVNKLKENILITHPKWKDGEFAEYYLQYNEDFNCVEIIDVWKVNELEYNPNSHLEYNFTMEDILDERWELYEY